MIWTLLWYILTLIARLFIPEPSRSPAIFPAPLPTYAPCAACGYLENSMLCVVRDSTPLIERTCHRCGARTYNTTISRDPGADLIHRADDDFIVARKSSMALREAETL